MKPSIPSSVCRWFGYLLYSILILMSSDLVPLIGVEATPEVSDFLAGVKADLSPVADDAGVKELSFAMDLPSATEPPALANVAAKFFIDNSDPVNPKKIRVKSMHKSIKSPKGTSMEHHESKVESSSKGGEDDSKNQSTVSSSTVVSSSSSSSSSFSSDMADDITSDKKIPSDKLSLPIPATKVSIPLPATLAPPPISIAVKPVSISATLESAPIQPTLAPLVIPDKLEPVSTPTTSAPLSVPTTSEPLPVSTTTAPVVLIKSKPTAKLPHPPKPYSKRPKPVKPYEVTSEISKDPILRPYFSYKSPQPYGKDFVGTHQHYYGQPSMYLIRHRAKKLKYLLAKKLREAKSYPRGLDMDEVLKAIDQTVAADEPALESLEMVE